MERNRKRERNEEGMRERERGIPLRNLWIWGRMTSATWEMREPIGFPTESRKCLPGQGKDRCPSRCQKGTQQTTLCFPCQTSVPHFHLPGMQQCQVSIVPVSREVGARAVPALEGQASARRVESLAFAKAPGKPPGHWSPSPTQEQEAAPKLCQPVFRGPGCR